jgi:hypothetical protein
MMMAMSLTAAAAEPSPARKWRSTSGHETQASAIAATAAAVTLELPSGKKVNIPLEKLLPEDRDFALKHFGVVPPKLGDVQRSTDPPLPKEGLAHPLGEISGQVESAPGSHYHIYLPKSLRVGRKAPVLHFNGSGGGSPGEMKRYVEGCDRFGWILVASVESHNRTHGEINLRHAENNIKSLRADPLVDPKRIYFTGQSGGGAMSWWNTVNLNGAGTMPAIGYIPPEVTVRKGHHFILGGASDYNRYHGGRAATQVGKNGFYRIYPGGHSFPKDHAILHEGIGWLTGKYLAANKAEGDLAGERLDYEAAMIDWIRELSAGEPWLACYLGEMLVDTYGISGRNGDVLKGILSDLKKSPQNVAFAEGVRAIHEFGVKDYGSYGFTGDARGRNNDTHVRALQKITEKYAGVVFVEDTLREMATPTTK